MVKFKEGIAGAALEIFQVVIFLKFEKKIGFLEDIDDYYQDLSLTCYCMMS